MHAAGSLDYRSWYAALSTRARHGHAPAKAAGMSDDKWTCEEIAALLD